MRVILVTEPDYLRAALALRFEVFVAEQGVSLEGERDALDDDPDTMHFLAIEGDDASPGASPVGVGRLLPPGPDGYPHIGRVAIARNRRRFGVGRALMEAIEEAALARYG